MVEIAPELKAVKASAVPLFVVKSVKAAEVALNGTVPGIAAAPSM